MAHPIEARIRAKLEADFAPERFALEDESSRHKGHGGYREGGGTHYRLHLVSPRFAGLGRVARHRLVYQALQTELAERVHALAMTLETPEEAARADSPKVS